MFNIVFFEDNIPTNRVPKVNGNCNLSTLKNGSKMFIDCSDISSFKSDLSSLINGYQMFQGCSNLASFSSELPSLNDAKWMFGYCSKLKTFTSDLSNVTDGDGAFYYCSDLTTFSTNLSNLSTGKQMFHYCTKLESFNVDLSNLCNGSSMFRGCEKLTSFTSDLSKLTYAKDMFNNCKNLTTVTSNLSSLVCGEGMFKNNRLSPMSVIYIIDSIRDISAEKKLYEDGIKSYVTKNDETGIYSASRGFMSDGGYVYEKDGQIERIGKSEVGTLTLGIDVINESETLQEQLQSFAEEAFFDSWAELQEMFAEKGWTVTFEYCGISQNYKYKGCKTVNDVKAVDPNYLTTDIVDGVWSERLDDLTNGKSMFSNCHNLISFTSDSSGSPVNLSSLTNGSEMFFNCSNLTSFTSDLLSLTDGTRMFRGCSKLTSFSSDLSSLTNGEYMFTYCKLDTASVQNIADSINTPSSKGTIYIGIGNTTPNEQEEAAFNKIASKNWTVYVGVGGGNSTQWNPTSLTPIDGEETTTPIPFWAKPVPATEERARYIDENGNYYNILGGNYVYGDDLSTYGMFTCEEDAAANMRLTKYVKEVEEK